jgi:NAD(P)-dependent dehydrogenase (short-subunit alcohol dehydrogenase family)
VTGGNTGIGEAVARRLGAQGANVAVIGCCHPAEAKRVAEEIRAAGGSALALAADLTRLNRGERMSAKPLTGLAR